MSKILKVNLLVLVAANAILLLTGDVLTVAMGLMALIIVQFIVNIIFAIYYLVKKDNEQAKWFLLVGLLVLIIGMGTCFANSYVLKEVFGKKATL